MGGQLTALTVGVVVAQAGRHVRRRQPCPAHITICNNSSASVRRMHGSKHVAMQMSCDRGLRCITGNAGRLPVLTAGREKAPARGGADVRRGGDWEEIRCHLPRQGRA